MSIAASMANCIAASADHECGSWGQVFHYEIATLSQLHNPANARVMQANACEFESERTGYRDVLAKYDNERPDPFSF